MLRRYRLVNVFILKHLVGGLNEEELENTFGDNECKSTFSITGCMSSWCWCRLHWRRKGRREQGSISLIFRDVKTNLSIGYNSGLPCISACSPCSTSALRLSSNSWYGVVVLKSQTKVVITRSQSVGESWRALLCRSCWRQEVPIRASVSFSETHVRRKSRNESMKPYTLANEGPQ